VTEDLGGKQPKVQRWPLGVARVTSTTRGPTDER